MPEIRRDGLTEAEINFCKYWKENVLTRPDRVSQTQLDIAANYINMRRTGNCSNCLHNDAVSLNNQFQLLYPKYLEMVSYQKSQALIVEEIKVETKKIEDIKEKTKSLKDLPGWGGDDMAGSFYDKPKPKPKRKPTQNK